MRKSQIMFLFVILCLAQPVVVHAQSEDAAEKQNNFSAKLTLSSALSGSGAYYFNQAEFKGGFEVWEKAQVDGNLGKYVSYSARIGLGLVSAKREYLGKNKIMVDNAETVDVYSQPLGYFPYTYRGTWGGFTFLLSDPGETRQGWPDNPSIAFDLSGGISGSAFNDILQWRIARTEHEAGGIVEGSSLALNEFAQPFFGYDLTLTPLKWLSLYSVTGILEYYNTEGIQISSGTFQSAFSLTMLTLRYKDYFQLDAGSSAIWPKRFELGYLFPLMLPILYQNNIGDFDNVTVFGNLKFQYPGLGFLWASLFIDEINPDSAFFKLDREMYAYQAGLRYFVPVLSSSVLTVSYTKIEPYCYTHQKTQVPWYDYKVQEAYTNHGYGLGYYLPPNSDEIKIVFDTKLSPQTALNLQFQQIRHGADYGDFAVDGSSYDSELNPDDRSTNPKLRKDFLRDGAYQTQYIIKSGIKYSVEKIPLEFSACGGMVFSYWSYDNAIIDTSQYPKRNGIILEVGARIFY